MSATAACRGRQPTRGRARWRGSISISAELSRVEALVFDVFGTLVDWRTSLIDDLTAFGADRGLVADWPALVDAWRGAYLPSMDRVRRGELPWTPLDALHRSSFDELAVRFGIDAALDEEARRWCVDRWHRLRPWPDTVAGLTRLRKRYVLGTLSNGNVRLLADLAKHAPLPMDVILSAELFRHYKPDPEVYRGAADLLAVPPGGVMLVAAHGSDLAAAARTGMRTAFVARPLEHGPAS
ncbi:MAG TPA: haloacid dehalogenase type II, partial [Candidatus Elarobacter sp.]|nr:haloacid dehalogenase type II [Candidatus Elarobacter sp.]